MPRAEVFDVFITTDERCFDRFRSLRLSLNEKKRENDDVIMDIFLITVTQTSYVRIFMSVPKLYFQGKPMPISNNNVILSSDLN
jgi:hypothetical protein